MGKHIVEKLKARGVEEENIIIPRIEECDLREAGDCQKIIKGANIVIHLAGIVGGIEFNRKHPGKAFYDNAVMSLNLIEASRLAKIEKFVGIGSVCAYPKFAKVPLKEEDLWLGYPEETNASYGLAKKFMLVQSQAYRQEYGLNAIHLLMLNLYGPGDNFEPETSHVIPAIIKKVADAKKGGKDYIEAWGTGRATRDFLYVEDAAEGIILAAAKYDKSDPINLGSGLEISVKNLVELICKLMDFHGKIIWDKTKPDGQPRRCLDVSLAEREFGFKAKTFFEKGLKNTIDYFFQNA